MISLFSAWKPMRSPVFGDLAETVEHHPVVGRRDVADRLAEKALVADDAGLGHRLRTGDAVLDEQPDDPEVDERLLLGELLLELDAGDRVGLGGFVFGMSTTVVTPPMTAAVEPVVQSSLYSRPGSRKWTCGLIAPGRT